MRRPFHTHPGESMIETMIAITVVIMGIMATLSMLRTALKGNQFIGEKLVAIQLANEALDAIRNIRDTNYLLLSADPENCWNRLNVTDPTDCLDSPTVANSIFDGESYYLIQDYSNVPYFKWSMISASETRGGDMNLYRINTTDEMDSTSTDATLYMDWHHPSSSGATLLSTNVFNRVVSIDYDPLDSSGMDRCPLDDCFVATAHVQWTVGDLTQSISLTRLFSNVY